MTERYLTEPEAWRRIAEAFYCRQMISPVAGPLDGVCSGIGDLEWEAMISSTTERQMRARLIGTFRDDAEDLGYSGYYWPLTTRGRLPRVAACLLLALLAEEDV